jgi:hypothetical protein
MRKKVLIALTIILGIFSIGFFYPKNAGGSAGFALPPPAIQRIEYDCIGFKYEYKLDCADCGTQILCYGILTGGKRCYTYINNSLTEVACGSK